MLSFTVNYNFLQLSVIKVDDDNDDDDDDGDGILTSVLLMTLLVHDVMLSTHRLP